MKRKILLLVIKILSVTNLVMSDIISTNFTNSSSYTTNYSGMSREGVTNNFVLPAGKQLIVHGINLIPFNSTEASSAFVRLVLPSGDRMDIVNAYSGSGMDVRWKGPVLGPMNLEIGISRATPTHSGSFVQTYCNMLLEIKDDPFQFTNTGSATISSASVVVPANATGDVDVLLEQSTDMITWTQCLPGTYNASTQKRFFRVRAVEK